MDYSLWLSVIFGKNMIDIKIHFYDIVWKFFWCWSQWYNPQLHISFTHLNTMRLSLDTGYMELGQGFSYVLC